MSEAKKAYIKNPTHYNLLNYTAELEQQNKHLINTIKNILNQTCREDIWKIAEETLADILK